MKHLGKIVAGFLLASGAALALEYTADNKMPVPADYREWVFLTASMDLNYDAPVPGAASMGHSMLDNIFVNPAAYKAFIATGAWPDKTVLIKENRRAEGAGELSKSGEFQAEVMSLEIHVKDEARFPGKWGFFTSDGKSPGRFMPRTANCYPCHQDHAAVDTTFVQFYPTLMPIAQGKGVLSPAYLKSKAGK
jgi:hypothetical protein